MKNIKANNILEKWALKNAIMSSGIYGIGSAIFYMLLSVVWFYLYFRDEHTVHLIFAILWLILCIRVLEHKIFYKIIFTGQENAETS